MEMNNTVINFQKPVAQYKFVNVTCSVYDKSKIPNKFQRWMQKICFGIEWEIFNNEKSS